MQTQEQEKGNKFEIFLERLLTSLGYQRVLRNVEYHKTRSLYRQVDISYDFISENTPSRRIVEAKFSSNGQISYELRSPRERQSEQGQKTIYNLIDEVLDKQDFVQAETAYLVTNHEFEKKVKDTAKEKGVVLVDGTTLEQLGLRSGTIPMGKSIDQVIAAIGTSHHNTYKNVIYIS